MHFLLEWQPDLAEVVKEIPRLAEASRLDLDEISKKVTTETPLSKGGPGKMGCDRRAQRRDVDSERSRCNAFAWPAGGHYFPCLCSRAHGSCRLRILVVTFSCLCFFSLCSFFSSHLVTLLSVSFCIFLVLSLAVCFLLDVNTACGVNKTSTGAIKAGWHLCSMNPNPLDACPSPDWSRDRSACKW